MKRAIGLCVCVTLVLIPVVVSARTTERMLAANKAAESELGRKKLNRIGFYMRGQQHRPVKHEVGQFSVTGRTPAVLRTDAQACEVAFLSALASLQAHALEQGGNAIVRIDSVTRGKETTSTSDYRCLVGATIAHVGLRGDIVVLDQ